MLKLHQSLPRLYDVKAPVYLSDFISRFNKFSYSPFNF